MKKLKIVLIISSILIPIILFIFGGLFILIFLLTAVASTSDDGEGAILRQTAGSAYYYDTYKKVLKNHLSTTSKTDTKGYVTISRTVLTYTILMDNYCREKVSTGFYLPAPNDNSACAIYDRLYKESYASQRFFTSILKPLGGDDIDTAYAKMVKNNDPIAIAKFNEAYELNLDERFRMVGVYTMCSNILEKTGTDMCANSNTKEYIDSLISSNSESDSSPNMIFVYPLDYKVGNVSSLFNVARNIDSNGVKSNGIHSGWDLSASANSKVYSACAGTVTAVSNACKTNTNGGPTNYVIVKCDQKLVEDENDVDIEVRYWHLYPDSMKVRVGDHVSQGQHIAGVGTTGNSTGNHLHFQVQYVKNPERRLDGFYFINWTLYFSEFLPDDYEDVEYDPSEDEENDEDITSYDEELEEKIEEEKEENQEQITTTKPIYNPIPNKPGLGNLPQ